MQQRKRQRGYTLVELVTVIVVMAVVGIGIASFVRSSVQIFVDVGEREQLLTESRFAIERLKRELRNAAPNSIRIGGDGTEHCIEFVPINWSTLYTRLPVLPDSSNEVEMVLPRDINGNVYPVTSSDYMLVYPRQSADVYDLTNNKRNQILECETASGGSCSTPDAADTMLNVTVDGGFAESSPVSRLYLVDHSVNFCVTNGRLVRFENDLVVNQASAPAGASVIASHVVNPLSGSPANASTENDPFRLLNNTLQRNAVVQIRLLFEDNEEAVAYQQEVHIANAP